MFKKNQLIILLLKYAAKAGIVIVLAIALVFILGGRIKAISVSLQEKKLLTMVLEKRNETIATLREDLKTIGDNDVKIRSAFLSTDNVLEFVSAMETVASQNSMDQTIKFGVPGPAFAETETMTVVPISYSVTANGTVTTLIQYLKQVESLPYFASITSVALATGAQHGWSDASSITMQGVLYVKKAQ